MSFLNLLTKTIIVSRLTNTSGDKSVYSTVTSEYVDIQRMTEEKQVMVGGAIGKTFRLYASELADIEKGDKLVDLTTGNEYKVIAVTIPADLGNFVHKECIITLVN